jgi:L-seryl-tRNA(Ser) seleniumtransferase
MPHLSGRLGNAFALEVIPCRSQVGSGALPQQTLSSAGIAIRPASPRGAGRLLAQLAAALRGLPIPIIGRVADSALILDCRCLDDEAAFLSALEGLPKMSSGA